MKPFTSNAMMLACFLPSLDVQGPAVGDDTGAEPSVSAQARPTGTSEPLIRDEAACIDQTKKILGLSSVDTSTWRSELRIIDKDDTPFLHGQIAGRPVWKTTITDWRIKLDSGPPGWVDKYSRTLDILLNPENGRALKIVLHCPANEGPLAPEPSAEYAEHQLRAGREIYLGFPTEEPAISFVQALDVIMKLRPGSIREAKEIVAVYVLRTHFEREARPVWVITVRGIAPAPTLFPIPNAPEDLLNHWRHIVDGRTGEWLGAFLKPQPERDAQGRDLRSPVPATALDESRR